MGAAVAVLPRLIGAAGLMPKPGVDTAIVTVKIGRVVYVGTLTSIGLLWYWGWRNERAGKGEFPIPFLYKGGVTRPGGAPDVDGPDDITLGSVDSDATPGNTITANPLQPPTANLAPTGAPTGLQGSSALLNQLGRLAPKFGVQATENPNFGGVSPVHTTNSFHYKGRAIDFVGPLANLATWAKYLDENYRNRIAELIWAGPQPKSVKNGASVPSSFWGAETWAGHKTHVHLAI